MPDLITGDVGGTPVSTDNVPAGVLEGQDWFSTTKQFYHVASGLFAPGAAVSGIPGVMPAQPAAPDLMAPEDATEKYGQKSKTGIVPDLAFDKPVPESVASQAAQDWHDKVARQDALQRAPGGFFNGAARFATTTGVFMLDPLNLAASVIPIVDEAAIGGALAKAGVGSLTGNLFARSITRMATGAISGAVNQVPLIGLRSGLSWADHGDYSAAEAMSDLVMGGVLGGGLHTLIGGAQDWMGRGFARSPLAQTVTADPVARDAAIRTSAAQLMSGEPVEVHGVVRVAAADRALAELASWQRQQARIDNDTTDALNAAAGTPAAPDRSAAIGAATARITQLQAEIATFQHEIEHAQRSAAVQSMDPETADRLAAVQAELAGTIPAQRRVALENEQTMLLEGRRVQGNESLDTARSLAEAQGLQAAQSRYRAALDTAQQGLDTLRGTVSKEAAAAQAARAQADSLLRVQSGALASRQANVVALTARTLRKFAGAIGADLDPAEAMQLAGRLSDRSLPVQSALRSISERRGAIVRTGRLDLTAPTTNDAELRDAGNALTQAPATPPATPPEAAREAPTGIGGAARAQFAEESYQRRKRDLNTIMAQLQPLRDIVERQTELEAHYRSIGREDAAAQSATIANGAIESARDRLRFVAQMRDRLRPDDRADLDAALSGFPRGMRPEPSSPPAIEPLQLTQDAVNAELRDAGNALAQSPAAARAQGAAGPEETALRQATTQAVKDDAALKVDHPGMPPEIEPDAASAAEQAWKRMQGGAEGETDQTRGMLTAAERAEMRQMDEEHAQAKKDASVWDAAAQCLIGGEG